MERKPHEFEGFQGKKRVSAATGRNRRRLSPVEEGFFQRRSVLMRFGFDLRSNQGRSSRGDFREDDFGYRGFRRRKFSDWDKHGIAEKQGQGFSGEDDSVVRRTMI
ncbi:hypothetical protein U1Q18_017007 [Sarracenia purpurea var. burkii]